MAISTNVDTGLEWLSRPSRSTLGISNMTGVLPGNDHEVSDPGAMHLLVGVGVPVRKCYGSGIVDLFRTPSRCQ